MDKDCNQLVSFFLRALGVVRASFRRAQINVQKQSEVKSVVVSVNPSYSEESTETENDYAQDGVTLNIALDADLNLKGPDEQDGMGVSLLIRRSNNNWIVEGEIGWSSSYIGWDQFYEKELVHQNISEVIEMLPPFVESLLDDFQAKLAEHLKSGD
ncbi:hypothetical protein [Pleionea sp. CnH1-48]|uniref:hypothetical protein n=1 Tax=Pleionea sp. CnH1-48 TaxID=2954494 RepID=UPI002096B737|nr:hypothetical protein [Pleionea sp. CnH1-48]MCO7227473.1 hypothetical protein [Pleionea sp. CnH1-48]